MYSLHPDLTDYQDKKLQADVGIMGWTGKVQHKITFSGEFFITTYCTYF